MKKKEFTSFDVAAAVRELKDTILDARVNNVYQLDGKTLLLKLHKPDEPPFRLVMEAGKRLHLTSYAMEKPLVPPAFCMALRRHLRNVWLANVEQYEFERVVVLAFRTKAEEMRLVLELFGDGNIILVDAKGRILQALHYKRMRDRNILRDEDFVFPPPMGKNPFKVSLEELAEELKRFGDVEVVRALARFLGVGGVYAEEALLRAGVDKAKPCSALVNGESNAVFDCLQSLLSLVANGRLEPCIVLDEAGWFLDAVPFRLRRYEGFTNQPCSSFNEALDEFYVRVTAVEKASAGVEAEALKLEAERLKRVAESQEKALTEAEAKAEYYRRVGDTIYVRVGDLQVLLDRFSAGKESGKKWSEVVSEVLAEKRAGLEPSVFFESFDAKGLVVNVCLDGLSFGLGLHRTLFESAADFYELSKRAKQKLEGARVALEGTRKKLEEAEVGVREAEALEHAKPAEALKGLAERRVKRKEWFEKFRWFVSSDGFLVVGGKDAVSNEVLIKKHIDAHDVVFHADTVGAPFVVIKANGKTISDQCLHETGEFAAAFSRGWREGFGSVDVYWVKPEQLSKRGPSGEYVPHGGFVVSGKRSWMRNVPLRISVGVNMEENGELKFLGGPIDAIKTRTSQHVTIVPGHEKGKELFKHVLKALAAETSRPHKEKILKASIDEMREFIPYNQGRVLEN